MYYTYRTAFVPVRYTELYTGSLKAYLKRPSQDLFSSLADDAVSVLAEEGWFTVHIPSGEVTEFGRFILRVGPDPDPITGLPRGPQVYEFFDVAQSPQKDHVPPDVCLLVGNIARLSGEAPRWGTTEVRVKATDFPFISTESVAVNSETITTTTDLSGHFEIPVVRGSRVIVEIPNCGLRCTITVPYDKDVVDVIDIYKSMSALGVT